MTRAKIHPKLHPMIQQVRFVRAEFLRGVDGVTEAEALRRFEPMNTIGWIVGHLAVHEYRFWVQIAQGRTLESGAAITAQVGPGQPATTPSLAEMQAAWHDITAAADVYLNEVTTDALLGHLEWDGQPLKENTGTRLYRTIYHYWYHIGEMQAIRQLLGHKNLPSFVGNMAEALYQPDFGNTALD
ncbi:MAG: DinB family protein [Chloroflexi bacterium]|nr:DinB family protein [Chloroflexota bacterium]